MQKQKCLLLVGLLLAIVELPWLGALPAKAQSSVPTPSPRYGVNAEQPYMWTNESAYVDVLMEGEWSASNGAAMPPLTANGYPSSSPNNMWMGLWFNVCGDAPGPETLNFYGEGIYYVYNGGLQCSMVPGTLSILPPNYPGNPTNNTIIIPANFPGNQSDNPVRVLTDGPNSSGYGWVNVPAHTPANPLAVVLYIPPNSPANPLNTVLTTFQIKTSSIPPLNANSAGSYNSGTVGTFLCTLTFTNINPAADPAEAPNNFHLTRQGYPAWQPGNSFYPVTATSYPIFTNEYLASFAPFCCIRFMDWMNTNNNTGLTLNSTSTAWVEVGPYTWANRPQLNYFGLNSGNVTVNSGTGTTSLGGGGRNACYENMIALCNATGCDMWMNVPLQASSDWKVGFANLVANDPVYHLNPWLHCYYEHSNEMWNWGFAATDWIDDQAQIDFPSYLQNPSEYAWADHGQEMAKQIMQDLLIMQPILGSMGRPIFAGQYSWPTYNVGAGLSWIQSTYGPPKNYLYAISGAPYFGIDPTAITGTMLTQQLAWVGYCKQYGLRMCGYESGTGQDPSQADFSNIFTKLETASVVNTAYLTFGQMWKANGGDLCNIFTMNGAWSKYGCWGLLPVGSLIYDLSNPACCSYNAAAAMNNYFNCNCGNATPPPSNTGSGSGNGNNQSSNNNSNGSSNTNNNSGNTTRAQQSGSSGHGSNGFNGNMRGFFGGAPRSLGGN